MTKKLKKPVSILLSIIMVFSMFAIVPLSASAAVGDVLSEDDYLTFTAEEAGSTVTLNVQSGSNFQYDLNGTGLTDYTAGTQITLANAGDYVRFSGTGTKFNSSKHFSITGKVACSGNVMSLRLNGGKVQSLEDYCFQYMFYNCTGLTTAPELPETTLADRCYYGMFQGCINLTKAPDLPATALAKNCYGYMFYGCKSLTELPELPATNLAYGCYSYMFSGCTSLTELPALPATTLAEHCYRNMFEGCTSLTELPALPATTLEKNCYFAMFSGCSKICISDEKDTFDDITYSAEYRIPTTGEGTSANNALNDMFTGTGGKFKGTPDINTTYYVPAPAPETFKAYAKKLTGETYTIENLTGETTVAQLKEIIAAQIDIPATAQRLVFAGKELEDAKTLAEYNIEEGSTLNLIIRGYTVTWLNYDNSELGTTTVQYGATPSYDGTPDRPEDADNTYTFSGWSDDSNTYAADALPAVSGDVTYTAVYTAEPKIPAPQLPDVIKDCTYYDSYCGFYANVPFAEIFSDIKNGALVCDSYSDTEKSIMDTKDYSYKFYDQTGTELQAENVYHDDSADGYGYRVIMNVFRFSNPISGPLYIVATAPAPKLFVGNTITLNADIGVNFFINSAYANFDGAQTATVVFTWDDGNYTKVVNLKELTKDSNGYYKATCDVVAAHMAHEIHAVVYLNGTALDETDDFSVQDYADKLFKNPKEYDTKGKPEELQALAKALLNYGSMAQTVFDDNLHEKPALANTNVGAWSSDEYAAVTADLVESKINGSSSDLNAVAAQLGAKYFTNSLIYLSKNTLRIYFTPTSYPGEIPNSDGFDGNLSGYYYYVDHAKIKAAELDDQQSFSVNGVNFTFSALDYVVAVIGSGSMTDTQKNLAKSLFLYNQAANAYFD